MESSLPSLEPSSGLLTGSMSDLESFLRQSRERDGRVPYELGAYIALRVCELLIESRPAIVEPIDVTILPGGEISIRPGVPSASTSESTSAVVALLATLLVAAGTSVPPELLSLAEHGPSRGQTLPELQMDLEAALLPLNRKASRRVLSRMLTETRSYRRPTAPSLTDVQLDAELDTLLGTKAAAFENKPISGLECLNKREQNSIEQLHTEATSEVPISAEDKLTTNIRSSKNPNRGVRTFVLLLLTTLTAASVFALLYPQTTQGFLGVELPLPSHFSLESSAETDVSPSTFGDLTVNATDGAQIFLHVGQSPTLVEDLPVGVAHEFLAIPNGREPSRMVLPEDTNWTEPPTVRIPLAEQRVEFNNASAGQTLLTRETMGAPSGMLGNVRIETAESGVDLYLLIGFGAARIEGVNTSSPITLVVFDEEGPREFVVDGDDFRLQGARLAHELEIPARPGN